MRKERLSKTTTAQYSDFREAGKALFPKCKEFKSNEKTDEECVKIQKRLEKFVGTCKACGEPLTYINDTNVAACCNTKCKGIRKEKTNKDDTKYTYYIPVSKHFNDDGMKKIENILEK